MKTVLIRAWHSPTIMTWLSYSTRAVTLFAVLPLVLSKFESGDVLLWYLFSTIISLQGIVDFGFRQTFSRIIAYAYSGARAIPDLLRSSSVVPADPGPNKPLLHRIVSSMKVIYTFLTVILFVLLAILGTWALMRPVSAASDHNEAWISWVIVIVVTAVTFYAKLYLNFLEGSNLIAMVRRVETVTSTCSIISSLVVMVWFPSVLNLVIVNQVWLIAANLCYWYLCRKVNNGLFMQVSSLLPFEKELFHQIWQPAWRTGISGLMSTGLTNVTGLVYAQFANIPAAASYLLALRIINQVKDFSMAPFYSKLPLLAMLRVKNEMDSLIKIVRRGMFLSHMVFVIGFILAGIFAQTLLNYIHSDVPFVSNDMWILLGIAFFLHRFGAMHMQVYLSTNHIISHIADGVSGAVFILSALILTKYIGIYAVPIGMIIGYSAFYCWYAAVHSYRSMNIKFYEFERNTSLLPAILFIIYAMYISIITMSHS